MQRHELWLNSTGPESWKYSEYEQILYSVQVPDGNVLWSDKGKIIDTPQMKRNVALDVLKKSRRVKCRLDRAAYEKRMKKMSKMVSTLLYHRICYTHMNVAKPTENALMFNEGMFLPSHRSIRTTCDYPMTTTFPIFQFTVATMEHSEICNHPMRVEDVDQRCFSKLHKWFHPENISKEILKKYRYLQHEIKEFINGIFTELSLDSEWVLTSLIYLERLISKAKLELRSSNWKPLLLTSIILSSKYWEDCCFWNYDFQEFWKYSIPGLNLMETRFLTMIGFDFSLSSSLYTKYYNKVNKMYTSFSEFTRKEAKKAEYRKHGFISKKKFKLT